ncbi:MAG: DNA-3-methyladenine glycosylase [Gemmatimonadota bacterium]
MNPATVAVPAAAAEHLSRTDPVMARLVGEHGLIEYRVDPDLWRSLVGSIVGQQLSVKAAATIRGRIAALAGEGGFPAPEAIDAASDETLRACGLSRGKLSYLRDLSRRWMAGEIDAGALADLDDDEVIERLVQIRGVGRWTAEMVLIFSLGRPDVLAVDDLGLRAGAERCYALTKRPDKEDLRSMGEPWRPYRSYASLYLWESLR